MRIRWFSIIAFLSLASTWANAAQNVVFEQRLGAALPLDAAFMDYNGKPVTIGSLLGGKPAVVCFNYFRCPELCGVVSEGTVDVLRQLRDSVGENFTVISISIDPTDTPLMAQAWQRRQEGRYGRTGAASHWHVLTGKPEAIERITAAAGFQYAYDAGTRQYAHPSGVLIVTPQGIISRYFLGVDYPAKDFARAVEAAREGKIGQPVFELVVNCIEGGLIGGPYGPLIWKVLWISVLFTIGIVFGGIGWMLRQEFKERARAHP